MLKNTLFVLLFCFFLSIVSKAQISKIDSSEMVTLRIDPESSRGAAVSRFFEEVNFIPLETTKESLFGSINQMSVTEDCFIIFDWDTKSVLIFNKSGKFKTRINASKVENPEDKKETQNFYGINLKTENGVVSIQINTGKYNNYFDLNGKFIKRVLTEKDVDTDREYLKFKEGTKIDENHLYKKDKDSSYYEIAILKNKKEVGIYFPYQADRYKNDEFLSAGGDAITNYGLENEKFFRRSYDYNIYKITPEKLFLAYRFIFPINNSIPIDFMENPVYKKKRIAFFEKNKDIFYSLSNAYKIGNLLFFKVHNMAWNTQQKTALIYHLKTTELTSIKDLEPDSLSSYLPITDAGFHYDFSNRGFLGYDNGYLYTSYSSLAMFTFKEQSTGNKATYPPLLTDYFKTGNKKNNPVIIQLKPKKD